jgi:hypothetical protein
MAILQIAVEIGHKQLIVNLNFVKYKFFKLFSSASAPQTA